MQELTQKLIEAMGLPEDHQIGFLSLHDALTSMQAHGKPIPQGAMTGWLGRTLVEIILKKLIRLFFPRICRHL